MDDKPSPAPPWLHEPHWAITAPGLGDIVGTSMSEELYIPLRSPVGPELTIDRQTGPAGHH